MPTISFSFRRPALENQQLLELQGNRMSSIVENGDGFGHDPELLGMPCIFMSSFPLGFSGGCASTTSSVIRPW